MSSYTYPQIAQAIKDECAKINLIYSKDGDGRITSAVKEREYLNLLEKGLKDKHPSLKFEHEPRARWWWDFRVNGIAINLKLTTGGTDNAFNKAAVIYSISGNEVKNKNMSYNQFFKAIKECHKKVERNHMTEYHYLVVNKDTGKFLLKSILDIHTFKTNPCNNIQINWSNEFKNIEFVTPDLKFKEKIQELLKAIQTCVKQAMAGMKEFADANIEAEFPK